MYQALYRKYRPQTFDEVVGQKSITQTLKAQLQSDKLSHAYLFTGTRGTGKTSCAKILAKAVNCEHPVDGNPCNCCQSCKSIDAGSCMDVLEIDAASNNGVDNVRSLRDDAIYTPSEVKKRVYIIDEVHMLSVSAFNALLKIIEEPPEHLLFILATTELHKVPATILSRCQRFSFRRLTPEDIAARINYAAYQEGIEITPEATRLLARLADGAMRDGMSLLDQCASSAAGVLDSDAVYRCLGLAGNHNIAQLFESVACHDTKSALGLFARLYAEGKDLAALLNEMCSLARDLLILKTAPSAAEEMLCGVCTQQEISALLPKFSGGELLRIVDLIQQTASGFNRSASRRIDVELCILQLCDPSMNLDAESLNARLTRLEDRINNGELNVSTTFPSATGQSELNTDRKMDDPPVFSEEVSVLSAEPTNDTDFWPELAEKIFSVMEPPAKGFFATGKDATVCGKLRGNVLELECETALTKRIIDKPDILEKVRIKAKSFFGKDVSVRVTVCDSGSETQNSGFDSMLSFGAQHSDIIKIF